jgi:hypothetical protein
VAEGVGEAGEATGEAAEAAARNAALLLNVRAAATLASISYTMSHPQNKHRLWLSVATQRLCGVDDELHAHQLLADLGSSHSAAHPDPKDGRICVYFAEPAAMKKAVTWIKRLKQVSQAAENTHLSKTSHRVSSIGRIQQEALEEIIATHSRGDGRWDLTTPLHPAIQPERKTGEGKGGAMGEMGGLGGVGGGGERKEEEDRERKMGSREGLGGMDAFGIGAINITGTGPPSTPNYDHPFGHLLSTAQRSPSQRSDRRPSTPDLNRPFVQEFTRSEGWRAQRENGERGEWDYGERDGGGGRGGSGRAVTPPSPLLVYRAPGRHSDGSMRGASAAAFTKGSIVRQERRERPEWPERPEGDRGYEYGVEWRGESRGEPRGEPARKDEGGANAWVSEEQGRWSQGVERLREAAYGTVEGEGMEETYRRESRELQVCTKVSVD